MHSLKVIPNSSLSLVFDLMVGSIGTPINPALNMHTTLARIATQQCIFSLDSSLSLIDSLIDTEAIWHCGITNSTLTDSIDAFFSKYKIRFPTWFNSETLHQINCLRALTH